jgi:Beta-propeller repeat
VSAIRHTWPSGAGFLAAALLCYAYSATPIATGPIIPGKLQQSLTHELGHLNAPAGRHSFYLGNDPVHWLANVPAASASSLTFSTFLGGSNFDQAYALAIDAAGNIYVTGQTASTNFPSRIGGVYGNRDVFVAKLNPAGTQIIYLTILGGQQTDTPGGIAVDASGNVYVTGFTLSTDFPTTTGAYQTSFRGSESAFVAKLNSSGALVYSTYLGGSGRDFATAIAIDSSGNAYVTGYTSSTDFPIVGGAYQAFYGGGFNDAFVTKLNPAGTGLVYSTFLGGTGDDTAAAIAIDPAGNAYICGETDSSNFPVVSALQKANAGGQDGFVAKLSATASALIFSTYLGGSFNDQANSIAIDSSLNVYIAGATTSSDFPVSPAAFQRSIGGTFDAFVVKLTFGATLAFSTFLGGSGSDQGSALAVDSAGNVWLAGSTSSTDFPLVNAFQELLAGGKDVFVATLNATGDHLLYSSYLGGASDDSGLAIGIDNNGSVVVGGITQSSNFPSTVGVVQPRFGGSYDGFVLKLKNGICPYSLSANALNVAASGGSGTITASAAIGCNAPTASSNVPWASASVVGNAVNWTITADPSSFGRSGALTINGQTVTITQVGLPCSYALNPASVSVGSAGGAGNIAVTPSPADCAVVANSGVSWASVSISGNNASWSVTADPSSLGRAGTFTIGGKSASVSQSGAACSYGLSSNSISAGSGGASGSITITALPGDCPPPSAASGVSWAAISMSGSAAPWTVSANAGTQIRNGTFTVAGQNVAITQSANATPGTLTLSRNVLNYGTSGSLVTSTQTVAVGFAGGSGVAWTVSSSQPNITVSGSGTGNGSFAVTTVAGASGTVTVTAPGAAQSPLQVQVNVLAVTPGFPTGSFDTPVSGATGIAGAIPVTGWALDNIEVIKVDVWRESLPGEAAGLSYIGDGVFVADARPDVEGAFPSSPFQYRGGWGYMLLTNLLPNAGGSPGPGNGIYALHAIAHNKAGNSLDLGTRTITVDNAHATRPFGTIDTPGQGAAVSGNAYVNFGWALTQNPYIIPTDGSTITVILDGQAVGHPAYNQYRSDIANFFPGLANSNGAIGFFYIDTTTLANGVHTISWNVYDNQGRGDGIGSRYFTVLNAGNIAVSNEEPVVAPSGEHGDETDVEIEQLDRIELKLGAARGYLLVQGERRPLPVGSSLKSGVFYWQAGLGFLGEYQLVFERPGAPDLIVRVTIRPKRFP